MFEQKKRLLLYRLRKEMNGAALDYMRYYGADYERNYGVQIYALRTIAEQIGCDDALARYFYEDNIREVRLVGAWIADAKRVSVEDFDFWAQGVINSEVAEQLSHALMSRIAPINELLDKWSGADNPLLAYTALLAAARSGCAGRECAIAAIVRSVVRFDDNALIVRGAAALAVTLDGDSVASILAQLPQNATATALREEVSWLCE